MNNDVIKLLQDRYFLKNENTWEHVAKRVGALYEPITDDIINMKFIPSSPTLMNANTKERTGTLSSCFPMNIEDSIEGIYEALQEAAVVTKYGGGIGYDFSDLRSSNETIKSIKRNSSGPLPFINVFNSTLDGIQQGGVRRGAGMALLSIYHPDILDFVRAKAKLSKYNRFNFSVKIDAAFYERLKNTPDEIHKVRLKDGTEIELIDKEKPVSVKQLWKEIVYHAWKVAEPGVFNETIAFNQCANTNLNNKVLSNPCAEFVNIPYTACSLGSINISKFVDEDGMQMNEISKVVYNATMFLNETLLVNKFPVKKITNTTLKTRPIGLGIMGLAHLLYKLKIPYNSAEALTLCKNLITYITLCSMKASVELAKEKGAYPSYDYELFMKANKRFFDTERLIFDFDTKKLAAEIKKFGIRNSSFTSIAPTGSISFIAETSSGIEPVFALAYTRKIEQLNNEYEEVFVVDPIFEEYLKNNFDEQKIDEIKKQVIENGGSCQKCNAIPADMRKVFVVASDINAIEHLNMLEMASSGTSLSVSKTINLPNTATEEEVAEVYLKAQEKGIIGVTVYRDGCREGILVIENGNRNGNIIQRDAPKRPKSLPCHIYRITVKGEQWIVFVGLYKEHPYEVFAGKVNLVDIPKNIDNGTITKLKKGMYQFEQDGQVIIKDIKTLFESGEQEALTRQISTNLRHGTPVHYVMEQLNKSHGTIVDFNKSISRALKQYMQEAETNDRCPNCNEKLIWHDGCKSCLSCGYAKCG